MNNSDRVTGLIMVVVVAALVIIPILVISSNNSNSANTNMTETDSGKPVVDVSAIQIDRLATSRDAVIIDTLIEGTGDEVVEAGDTVEVHYLGVLTDGTPFDNSYDRGSSFSFTVGVGSVIQGWDQGLLGAKKGEDRLLLIPSDLAYGSRGAGSSIGPDTDLVFHVRVIDITKQ